MCKRSIVTQDIVASMKYAKSTTPCSVENRIPNAVTCLEAFKTLGLSQTTNILSCAGEGPTPYPCGLPYTDGTNQQTGAGFPQGCYQWNDGKGFFNYNYGTPSCGQNCICKKQYRYPLRIVGQATLI